jgi:uncharacterized membrane protein YcaP (DUF421 family)
MMIHSWHDIVRILTMGASAYVALVFLLRISGKRTLSKMNAFDFVVTVALGSTLATVFLDKSISLVEGIVALALLVALQFVITWLSVRVKWIDALVKSEPTLIASEGQYLMQAMRRQRVTKAEIDSALREHGYQDISHIACVVLEADGSISVVPRDCRRRNH